MIVNAILRLIYHKKYPIWSRNNLKDYISREKSKSRSSICIWYVTFDCRVSYNCNQRQLWCGVKVTQVQKDKRGWVSVCNSILVRDIVLQSSIDLLNGTDYSSFWIENYNILCKLTRVKITSRNILILRNWVHNKISIWKIKISIQFSIITLCTRFLWSAYVPHANISPWLYVVIG